MHASRHGTILIIVAGISALLASLALAFLARMRSDVEESQLLLQHAQAKIMLAAGCSYVQETSRIGWDRYPSTPTIDLLPIHEEAYGWVDVRDGSIGPKGRRISGTDLSGPELAVMTAGKWPSIGSHVRCPMYAMRIPPYATKLTAAPNAMVTTPSSSPDYCYPLLRKKDPLPVDEVADTYARFAAGDRTPVVGSQGRAWFRVFRDGPGTFIITCGAGGTLGYKSWTEVGIDGAEAEAQFSNDRALFESLRNAELRLYYRIEWTAAVTELTYHNLQHEIGRDTEHYETWPPNASHTWSSSRRTQTWMRNPVGTIRWIEALLNEPSFW